MCTFSFCRLSFQNESQIFPPTTGGGEKLSADSTIPLLGKLPLDPRIGEKIEKCFLIIAVSLLTTSTTVIKGSNIIFYALTTAGL